MTARKTFTSERDAKLHARALDKRWGEVYGGKPLPRVEDGSVGGQRHGPGPHGPWPTTERYAEVEVSADGTEYGVITDSFAVARQGERVRVKDDDDNDVDVDIDVSDAEVMRDDWFDDSRSIKDAEVKRL